MTHSSAKWIETSSRGKAVRSGLLLFAAWLSYFLIQSLLEMMQLERREWTRVVTTFISLACVWTLITPMIVRGANRIRQASLPLGPFLILHAAMFGAAMLVDAVARQTALKLVLGKSPYALSVTAIFFASMTAITYAVTLIMAGIVQANESAARQARYELALEGELTRARLSFLQAQLQPHFLFNALSTIAELIATAPERAVLIIRQLAKLFRYSVATSGDEVHLEHELEVVLPYLEVQSLRFADWITIRCAIEPDTLSCMVPPLLLQPLVENAIRHGLHDRDSAGVITIGARREGSTLFLTVSDNGAGVSRGPDLPRLGIGLTNIRDRLETQFGARGALTLSAGESNGTIAEIRLPVVTEKEAQVEAEPPRAYRSYLPSINAWANRHPVSASLAAWTLSSAALLQQHYGYLWFRHRSFGNDLTSVVLDSLVTAGLCVLMIPVIRIVTARIRLVGTGVRFYGAHAVAAMTLSLIHAEIWAVIILNSYVPEIGALEKSSSYALLVYVCVVLFIERGRIDAWVRERQLATARLVAAIDDERVRASRVWLNPEDLADELDNLESNVAASREDAEEQVTLLAARLRRVLDLIRQDVSGKDDSQVFFIADAPSASERAVERDISLREPIARARAG